MSVEREILSGFAFQARERPGTPALVVDGQVTRYGDLLDEAVAIARGLRARGIGRGDRVGILMPNGRDYVRTLLGTWLAGSSAVPVNARYRGAELSHVVRDSGVRVLVTSDEVRRHVDYQSRIQETFPRLSGTGTPRLRLPEAPALEAVVVFGDDPVPGIWSAAEYFGKGSECTVDVATLVEREQDQDVALIPYTSGTTSLPKGCLLTFGALAGTWKEVGVRIGIGQDSRCWNPMPLFHLSGVGPLIATLGVGGTFYTTPHFEVESALEVMRTASLTHLFPNFSLLLNQIVSHSEFADLDLSTVEAVWFVAEPDTMRDVESRFPGAHLINVYGLSETCGVVAVTSVDDEARIRFTTNGLPLSGTEVRIVDSDTGLAVDGERPGEIQVRGPNVMSGYLGADGLPQETADVGGWFPTGDVGLLRSDGRLVYRGRIKEMLKVGGENVAPAEVESHLLAHPSVLLAVVVGIDDDRYDEVPAAFVQLIPGTTLSESDIIDWCSPRMAGFKVPRVVRFVEEWPMSATKVQRGVLREQLSDKQTQ